MSRHIFNLIDHGTNMAGVGVRKGMSRQGKVPTEKEIQNIFDNNPNIKPPQPNAEARHSKDTDRDLYTSNRKQLLRNEGEAAASKVAEKFPFVATDAVNEKKLPLLRDFFSRQTTLPEHLIDLQTEGNWQNEDGSIKEGAIPPVNALRRMSVSDIANIGRAGDEGLVPLAAQRPNNEWEKGFDNINHTLPVSRAGFVMPADKESYLNTVTGNTRGNSNLIAIRGFGAPQDKAFKRKPIRESKEGIYTAPIPPERLVGAFRNEVRVPNDLDISEKLRIADEVQEEYIKRNNVLPFGDEIVDEVTRRVSNLSRFGGKFENKPLVAAGFDDLEIQNFLNSNKNQEFERFKQEKTPGSYDYQEPWMYSGTFGLNNPILTDEEKNDYITQIKDQWELTPGKVNYLNAGQMQSEGLPNQILYPNVAGANQNIQTGEPMEIVMQLLKQELQEELDQRYTQLPQEFLPTAQQIQDSISEAGIARTPQEFEETEVLGGKNERARQGYTAKRYLNRLGTEGALAEGIVRRDFPLLNEFNIDATTLPVLRDYTSRQTTLPEHDWSMQTEGPHFDEYGNILPGAIPPVNAVKTLGAPDIKHIGSAGNFGLKPVKDAKVNFEWEKSIAPYHDSPISLARRPIFPVDNAGFVSPINALDVRQAEAANIDPRSSSGMIAIRGFGAPSDKAFSRKDTSEGREAIYTAPIPPERLVGAHREGGFNSKEIRDNMLTSAFDDENIVQQINLPDDLPKKDFILNEMKIADKNNDFHQFAIEMDTLFNNGEISFSEHSDILNAFEKGQELQRKQNREQLPEEWSQGSFGFNNPILTPEEKEQYRRQVLRILSGTDAVRGAPGATILRLQDYLRQGLNPTLNPRGVKKATVSPRQYREYLEDRMFSQPIHHSIRIQPERYKPPTLGRELTTEENLRFADSYRDNTNLPLSIEQIGVRNPLFGRHVYPNELFSINPSFISASRSDLPMSYKDPSRKLHMYGFEGKTTPQRFARNVQPEGIVYGDVPEDLVQRFTTKPVRYEDLRQAARALLPTTSLQPHELREKQQDVAAMLMSSGVAPALTSTGLTVEDPSDADVLESIHDPFTQWSQNQQRLNIPTEDLLYASEPMNIAMRLLKRDEIYDPDAENKGQEGIDWHPGEEGVDWDSAVSSSLHPSHDLTQRHPFDYSMHEYDHYAQKLLNLMRNRDVAHLQNNENPMTEDEQFDLMDAQQKLQASIPKNTHFPSIQNAVGYDKDGNKTSTFGDGRPKFNEGSPRYQELIGDRPTVPIHTEGSFYGVPFNEETGFTRSEPMNIAMRLLKERVSPEAKRHKLEYDKKYESSPERVKYREDLNRERRRRGIYGSHNHQDVSHTEGGKLTLEGEHENRARHFKDKGTLRHE